MFLLFCVQLTNVSLVLVVADAPQQLSVCITYVRLDLSDQLVPASLGHHWLSPLLPLLLQDSKRSCHLVPFGSHQLPYLLLWSEDEQSQFKSLPSADELK